MAVTNIHYSRPTPQPVVFDLARLLLDEAWTQYTPHLSSPAPGIYQTAATIIRGALAGELLHRTASSETDNAFRAWVYNEQPDGCPYDWPPYSGSVSAWPTIDIARALYADDGGVLPGDDWDEEYYQERASALLAMVGLATALLLCPPEPVAALDEDAGTVYRDPTGDIAEAIRRYVRAIR